VHGGGTLAIDKTTQLYASGLFMQQAGAREIDLGLAVGWLVNGLPDDPTVFYIGSWYRFGDAINPYVGLEINNIRVGMSYDVNVSSLVPASLHRGGFEISLIYIKPSNGPSLKGYKCPKF
jgi:hypothetical protein